MSISERAARLHRESIIIDYAFSDALPGYREKPDFLAGRNGFQIRDAVLVSGFAELVTPALPDAYHAAFEPAPELQPAGT